MTRSRDVNLVGYRQGPRWLDYADPAPDADPGEAIDLDGPDRVPYVEFTVTGSAWPWLLRRDEIAAALTASRLRLDGGTDLDQVAHAAVRGVLRVGMDAIRYAETATADIATRLATPGTGLTDPATGGPLMPAATIEDPDRADGADGEDVLMFVELWWDTTRYQQCVRAAALLCRYAPPMLHKTRDPGHCPTLDELSDPDGYPGLELWWYDTDDHHDHHDDGDSGDDDGWAVA